MIYFSISCILISVVLIFKYKKSFRYQFLTLFILFLSLVLTVTYAVSNYFTDKGIDASVIYHLRYGLGEAGFEEYARLIAISAVALTSIVILFYYAIRNLNKRKKEKYSKDKLYNLPLILSIFAVVFNPASENIYSLTKAEFFNQVDDNDEYIEVNEINIKDPLNLIYIYAESLEETYFDEKLFPGLMPNLSNIRNQAIVFKNVAQVTHSGWTVAGMVASQCGIPLFSASHGNAMSGMPQFLSGATCLGDVLTRNNYDLSYLGGASLTFAGKGNFYKSHGFTSIQGRAELVERLEEPSYKSAWGLYDDSLLAIAKEELAQRYAQKSPFALFMLTLDTHHPVGHLSASCTNQNYADGNNEILNAVHCSDKLISEFIDYIHANGFDKNTLIVIGSDHLAMKNTATDLLNQGDRKNMLIMLPPGLKEGRLVNTPSSILDVSATILPLLGFESEELGFGRNILNENKPKLIEKNKNFDRYLTSSSNFVASFWNYPEAVNDIVFKEGKNKANFGEQTVKYPALFLINDNYLTDKVLFEFDSENNLSEYLQEEEKGTSVLWIDQCSKVNAVFDSAMISDDMQNCVAIGQLGSQKIFIKRIDGATTLSKKEIANELSKANNTINQENYEKQIRVLNKLARNGENIDDYNILPNDSIYTSIFIKSASGVNNGESYIKYLSDSSEKTLEGFERGLNLVGFRNGSPPQLLDKIDTCKDSDGAKEDKNITDILNKEDYDFYLLIAQDSTFCESDKSLNKYLNGTTLKLWKDLSWRQAYVSIIYKNGESLELLGEKGQSIKVILK